MIIYNLYNSDYNKATVFELLCKQKEHKYEIVPLHVSGM